MNIKKLADQAKKQIDQRGGTKSLQGDLQELAKIAKSKGTAADKAKRAADAIKVPGKK